MNNIMIVYKSVTGFTERYAQWIAAALDCDTVRLKDACAKQLSPYKTVVFGSRIHAGRIDGLDRARKLVAGSGAPKLILFATGGAPAEATPVIEKIWQDNLTPDELQTIPHFYMPGGLCYEKMPAADRLIMKLAANMMGKAKNKDAIETGFAQALTASYDSCDEAYILPLVNHIKAGY